MKPELGRHFVWTLLRTKKHTLHLTNSPSVLTEAVEDGGTRGKQRWHGLSLLQLEIDNDGRIRDHASAFPPFLTVLF